MTNQHPITTPPELVQQWAEAASFAKDGELAGVLATAAARWGWDQRGTANDAELQEARDKELEACCEWLRSKGILEPAIDALRAARRPKPPSLKEQAYDALDTYIYGEPDPKDKERTYNTIRKALEALPE
jgi:hypothetical protein